LFPILLQDSPTIDKLYGICREAFSLVPFQSESSPIGRDDKTLQ
jgi:hypothetical protein